MITTAVRSLQEGVYEALSTYTPLTERVGEITDSPDKDTPSPYVVIGEDNILPFETKSSYGEDITTTLHIWDDKPTKKNVQEIMALIMEALSRQPINVGRFIFVTKNLVNMNIITDLDGVKKHGIISIRFTINQ
ncbi:tail terminator [Bacillus phage vB_BspS_SplendidRed]|uniref:DUF3168 domain-containing protein n=1 Tax=Bacillus phage vB_BspS_SplendidRed TaxID=2591379 RepID=A0A5B9NLY2_9CAUD|nr:tail terminator [Bacillus phage vB_BspS_SplendidRed]QEG13536.1 hypothetical protein SPLENDIDRED_62 [Bacillus phage vB_BspS_SplendidRed]